MPLLTNLDIINAACARIGEEPVESLEDDLGGGQSASLIYRDLVDFNLGLQPAGFSFAREMRQLSRLTDCQPFTGYKHVFEIPGSYTGLPVFLTDDIKSKRPFTDYELSGGKVHADVPCLFAMVKFTPDPDRWTATFRFATITALGGHLAFAIASDRNTKDSFLGEAYGTPTDNFRGGQMRAAIFEEGFANPPRRMAVDRNPLEQAWRS